ncbi:MAG: peptidoglycan DD-metalloendopeptidase family protein [Phaeodactylibacter sp.]|nr:peptidoglycan DD-metalloendopeptidase family protein [Phaeodactylibacter sp.]MCB9302205.1 peptidoglycan DD-metalloendopeptidase family protein [Lewinellaceae bacterium]
MKFRTDIRAQNKAGAKLSILLGLALAFLLVAPLHAQNRKDLETKRQQLIRDIQQTESQLKETKKDKAATLDQYLALQSQIRKREQLIHTLHEEIDYANESINRSREVLAALTTDVEQLKAEYARIIRTAYRHKLNNSFILFLFSADSFNDAFRRWQYLRQYDRFRKKQARLIMDTQGTLARKARQLESRKKEKEALLTSQEQQQQLLNRELADKNRILKTLKTSESKLVAELDQQQKAHNALNNAIEAVIREEMARKRREARSADAVGSNSSAGPEENAPLSNEFQKNQGRLPWPVRNGVITRQFGKQPHPSVPSIQIANNGIDIRTDERAQVFAVFEGKVAGTQFIPGYKNTVIIQHGKYYTVYSNLDEIYIKRGDPIGRQQAIGILSTDKPEVHFEVWLEKKRLNPVDWVAKHN